MTIVKMHTIYAGPKARCHIGEEIDLPEEEATELVKGNYAEYVHKPAAKAEQPPAPAEDGEESEPETAAETAAAAPAAETADATPTRRRAR